LVPYFYRDWMISEEQIRELIEQKYRNGDLFIVDIRIGKGNEITIRVDKDEGITIDECAGISRFIGDHLGRESGDYNLVVSSPGLDMPFRVQRQYEKHLNKMVEVVFMDGHKQQGKLIAVSKKGIELECIMKPDQQKNSNPEETCRFFDFDQIKTTKPVIDY